MGAAGRVGTGLHHRLFQRGQPDSGADDSPRRRTGDSGRAGCEHRRAAARPAGGKPPALRRGSGAGRAERAAHGGDPGAVRVPVLGPRAGSDGRLQHAVGRRRTGAGRRGAAGVCAAPAVGRPVERNQPVQRERADDRRRDAASAGLRDHPDRRLLCPAGGRRHAAQDAARAAGGQHRHRHAPRARDQRAGDFVWADGRPGRGFLQRSDAARTPVAGRRRRRSGHPHAVARGRHVRPRLAIHGRRLRSRDGGRRSARPIPHRVARIFRRARRADDRRTRFQRSRPQRQRAGGDRQPKRGAADVSEPGGAQPAPHLDRSRDQVHRHEADADAHRRNRRGYRR